MWSEQGRKATGEIESLTTKRRRYVQDRSARTNLSWCLPVNSFKIVCIVAKHARRVLCWQWEGCRKIFEALSTSLVVVEVRRPARGKLTAILMRGEALMPTMMRRNANTVLQARFPHLREEVDELTWDVTCNPCRCSGRFNDKKDLGTWWLCWSID
jgi:hypothetical protein